jgi:hypothetical protein
MTNFSKARILLREFKGDAYLTGVGVLSQVGRVAAELGKRAVFVHDVFPGAETFVEPARPVFDYAVTYGAPPSLTADGALDGISHCVEVLYGAVGKPYHESPQGIQE